MFQITPELRNMLILIYRRYGKVSEPNDNELQLLFESLSTWKMMIEIYFDCLRCYSDDGEYIVLTKFIKNSKNVKIIQGKLNDRDVVIKYTRDNMVNKEIEHYNRLMNMGCSLPWFSNKFKFWRDTVLVLEKLEPITQYDDEYKIGRHVIKQLRHVHTFGCHSDIKPSNIMKKKVNKKYKYFLIDYGGMATKPLNDGYRRWTWTKNWTTQDYHVKNQVITPRHDLLELCVVLNAIQNKRKSKEKNNKMIDSSYISNEYNDRLKSYIVALNDMTDIYNRLLSILK